MSGSLPLRIPHSPRSARADARLVGAWIQRSGHLGAPALLSFVGADFMERFFEGVGRSGPAWTPSAWEPRVAFRDWSEPPEATRSLVGSAVLAAGLSRRPPLPGELDPRDGGGDLAAALAEEADGPRWLRKLYLPLHRQFTLVTTELICDAPGNPRIDPARVKEVCLVVRRLVPDPTRERWEDWVQAPDGGGLWVELDGVDLDMRRDGVPLDPCALPRALTYEGLSDATMRAQLGVTAPDRPLTLATTRMAALPPTLGESGHHTAHYGALPLQTREMERAPAAPADLALARLALAAEARRGLERAFTAENRAEMRRRRAALLTELNTRTQRLHAPLEKLFSGGPELASPLRPVLGDLGAPDQEEQRRLCLFVLNGVARARLRLRAALQPGAPAPTAELIRNLGAELQALLGTVGPQSRTPPAGFDPEEWSAVLAIHEAALRLEALCGDFLGALAAGGAAMDGTVEQSLRTSLGAEMALVRLAFRYPHAQAYQILPFLSRLGLDLHTPLGDALLVEPSLFATDEELDELPGRAETWYAGSPATDCAQEALRPRAPLPRFDADHVYAARGFARVRGLHPCDPEQLAWSERTEPYLIAEPLDLLGMPPAPLRLPNIPKLMADIPRVARARAMPMVAAFTPKNSGFQTTTEFDETTRGFGVAWICSYGIPVFTICAWVLFLIIFSILVLIPGFGWMLLLKFCIPVPRKA